MRRKGNNQQERVKEGVKQVVTKKAQDNLKETKDQEKSDTLETVETVETVEKTKESADKKTRSKGGSSRV
ncbi:hypothetical protein ACUC2M_03940 [Bacillus cytotoxicus]